MTIIEAMSYGIPIVITNISTMLELLVDSIELIYTGNIKQLNNLILKLFTNLEIRKEYSRIVFERANIYFTINENIRRTIEIYENLI